MIAPVHGRGRVAHRLAVFAAVRRGRHLAPGGDVRRVRGDARVDRAAVPGAIAAEDFVGLFDIPHGVFVHKVVAVAVFGRVQHHPPLRAMPLEIHCQNIAQLFERHAPIDVNQLFNRRQAVRYRADAHAGRAVNGRIDRAAIVDVPSPADTVAAEAAQEGRNVLLAVVALVFIAEAHHVFRRAEPHLRLEGAHEIVHRLKGRDIAGIRPHLHAGLHARAAVERQLNILGHVVAPVRPRRLHALNEVFNAAHHAVIARVLDGIAVPRERRNIHLVVHERGIAQPCADDLQTLVEEILRYARVDARRQIRPGNIARAHGVEDDIGQLVQRVLARFRHAADGDVHHVVRTHEPPLADLVQRACDQLTGLILREPPRVHIALIIRIEELIHAADRHGIAPLVQKRRVHQPHELKRLPERFRRGVRHPFAHGGSLLQPLLPRLGGKALYEARKRPHGNAGRFEENLRVMVVRMRLHGARDALERAVHALTQEGLVIGRIVIAVGDERPLAIAGRDGARPLVLGLVILARKRDHIGH